MTERSHYAEVNRRDPQAEASMAVFDLIQDWYNPHRRTSPSNANQTTGARRVLAFAGARRVVGIRLEIRHVSPGDVPRNSLRSVSFRGRWSANER